MRQQRANNIPEYDIEGHMMVIVNDASVEEVK